jgi:hypothetical protein
MSHSFVFAQIISFAFCQCKNLEIVSDIFAKSHAATAATSFLLERKEAAEGSSARGWMEGEMMDGH